MFRIRKETVTVTVLCAVAAVAYWRSRERDRSTNAPIALSPASASSASSSKRRATGDALKPFSEIPVVVADERRWRTENHYYLDELFRAHGDTIMVKRAAECDSQIWTRDPDAFRSLTMGARAWTKRDWKVEGRLACVSNLIQPMFQFTFFQMAGAPWKQRRRVMNPLFSVRHEFIEAVLRDTAHYVRDMRNEIGDAVVDLTQHTHVLFQRLIYRVCVGVGGDGITVAQLAQHQRVVDYFVKRYLDGMHDASVTKQDVAVFDEAKLVGLEALRAIKQRVVAGEEAAQFGMVGAMLSNSSVQYDDDEIAETFANFMVAGAESPAISTGMTLVEIARHAEVVTRLREEIAANVPLTDTQEFRSTAKEWLMRLPFTQACIEEGLRMFAPATIVSRQSVCETSLAGYRLPKHTVVGGCMHSLHYDERYWPQPYKFVPERHLKGSPLRATMSSSSKGSFAPFSFGAMKCPGGPITLAISKIIMVFLLRDFELAPVDDAPDQELRVQKFVTCYSQGTPVRLKRRTQ